MGVGLREAKARRERGETDGETAGDRDTKRDGESDGRCGMSDDDYQRFILAAAEACRCCQDCSECPCGGCLAGGICDDMACHCDDEPEEFEEDE